MNSDDDQVMEDAAQTNVLDLPAEMFRSGDEVEEATVQIQHHLPGFRDPSILNVDVNYTGVGSVAKNSA